MVVSRDIKKGFKFYQKHASYENTIIGKNIIFWKYSKTFWKNYFDT